MGKTRASIVLDAGALIALERGDARLRALCRECLRSRTKLVVPAGVLAQVWRGGPRQAVLQALLGADDTVVAPLDAPLARAVGVLCGKARSSDVVDASVVLVARREGTLVISSDPDDLRRLDPTLRVEVV